MKTKNIQNSNLGKEILIEKTIAPVFWNVKSEISDTLEWKILIQIPISYSESLIQRYNKNPKKWRKIQQQFAQNFLKNK